MVEQTSINPDIQLDLGKKSCGDLVISLMKKVRTLEVGQVLELRAEDKGAQNDIPAWCRMTGNALLAGPCGEDNAFYFIKIAPR